MSQPAPTATPGALAPTGAARPSADDEQAAREGAAFLELPERSVLGVSGPQRQKFLQGMLSNDVAGRGPGQGCAAAFLDVKGHVLALVRVLVEPATVALELPADRREHVQRTLEHYRVAAPVRFEAKATRVLAVLGAQAGALLESLAAGVTALGAEDHLEATVDGAAVRVARASDVPRGFVLHALPDAVPTVAAALARAGVRSVSPDALHALRVEALRPWYGPDVSPDNLLHETGLVPETCSFSKGCYLGQEVIARLDARGGNVSRALRGLRLGAPADPGQEVQADGAAVGRVTTSAVSHRHGPIALAYVRRNHFAPGTAVSVAGAPATVVTSFADPA
jgi:folate-binding protein YgfZ